MKSDADILQLAQKRTGAWEDATVGWLDDDLRSNYAFVAGDQWPEESLAILRRQRRPAPVFNRINPFLRRVVGLLISNRREAKYEPVLDEEFDERFSETVNLTARWCRKMAAAESEERRAFRDMLICGVGFIECRMDYSRPKNSHPIYERVYPEEMRWDPDATQGNLTDARWMERRRLFSEEEFLAEFGEERLAQVKIADALSNITAIDDNKDYFDRDGKPAKQRGIEVRHHQWKEQEDYVLLTNPALSGAAFQTMTAEGLIYNVPLDEFMQALGQSLGFDGTAREIDVSQETFAQLRAALEPLGVPLDAAEYKKSVYYQAMIANGAVLKKGRAPIQEGFSWEAITGEYDEIKRCWFGLVRLLKDPQLFANKSFSNLMHAIMVNPKGGLLFEKGAVLNKRELEEKWVRGDTAIELADGAISGNKLRDKSMPQGNTGFELLYQISNASFEEVSGVRLGQTLFNADPNAQFDLQQDVTELTMLAEYFDSMNSYYVRQGRKLIEYIRLMAEETPGRLLRITGEDGAEFVRLLRENIADEYDVEVQSAPVSPHQQQKNIEGLVQLAQSSGVVAQVITPLIIDNFPNISKSLKDKIMVAYEQATQPQQPDPEVAEMERQIAVAELQRRLADIEKDRADVNYTNARAAGELADIAKTQQEMQADALSMVGQMVAPALQQLQGIN